MVAIAACVIVFIIAAPIIIWWCNWSAFRLPPAGYSKQEWLRLVKGEKSPES